MEVHEDEIKGMLLPELAEVLASASPGYTAGLVVRYNGPRSKNPIKNR
jgi:hypothetical protein